MVLSTETFNQSVRTEYSEAVNARYTFQPLWISVKTELRTSDFQHWLIRSPDTGFQFIYLLYQIWSRNAPAMKRAENIFAALGKKKGRQKGNKINMEELLILEFLRINYSTRAC